MILHSPDVLERYHREGTWGSQTLHDLLASRTAQAPDAIALVDPPDKATWVDLPVRRLTWTQVLQQVGRLAAALRHAGFRKDDILLAQCPNVAEFVLLHLACARLGVVISPVHVQHRAHEITRCAEVAQPRGFVTFRRIGRSDQQELVAALPLATHWLEDLLASDRALDPASLPPVSADDLYSLCWTSGTEGAPKGVPRSHNNWIAVARRIILGADLRPGDVLVNPFPLVAVAGLTVLLPWLLQGGRLVLHQPADLAVLLRQLREEEAQYVCIAPALLNRLLLDPALLPPGGLPSLRVIGSGSGPLDAWTIGSFREQHGIEIVNFYGSNEGVGLVSGPRFVPQPQRRCVLFPAAGRGSPAWGSALDASSETRLLDPATGEAIDQPGQPGELVVRGPTVFPGYWRAPEQTARAFTADGFYRTGDMFCLEYDEELRPYYRFLGRYKDIIIRGGMKISPEELDALLAGHPLLKEAACCGYRDAVMGQKVGVCVVPVDGQAPALADITGWLRDKGVATFKHPEALAVIDSLPRNGLGKVLRRELPPHFAHVATEPPT